MGKIDANKEELILKLANGLGVTSPSGKLRWTASEIARHPEINSTRQNIGQILARRKEAIVPVTQEVANIKQNESNMLTTIGNKMLKELQTRDYTSVPTDKLAWSATRILETRDNKEKLILEKVNTASILKWIQDKERKEFVAKENKKIINITPKKEKEVEDAKVFEVPDG